MLHRNMTSQAVIVNVGIQLWHTFNFASTGRDGVVTIDIDNLTEEELIGLNSRIVERLNFLSQMRAHALMLEFNVGEKVIFTPDGRESVVGTLTKYNKKTVTVLADDGRRWNVAPGYLRKYEAAGAPSTGSNIVPFKST
jgi:hypothetical protein